MDMLFIINITLTSARICINDLTASHTSSLIKTINLVIAS